MFKLTGNILTRPPPPQGNAAGKKKLTPSCQRLARTRRHLQKCVTFLFLCCFLTSPILFSERNYHPNLGKMVLWASSPPSSWSVDFLNKGTIPCSNNSSLNLLACHTASAINLDPVRKQKYMMLILIFFKESKHSC